MTVVIMAGTRENFYDQLKQYMRKRKESGVTGLQLIEDEKKYKYFGWNTVRSAAARLNCNDCSLVQ